MAVGTARLGAPDQLIVAATLGQLTRTNFGSPLHSLVLVGSKVHELEIEFLRYYAPNKVSFDEWANLR
jgi:diphthine synthase